MAKDITIFTTNTCSSCKMIKMYLGKKGINYQEVNLEDHPERRDEVYTLSHSLTVPVTVVTKVDDSKEVIVGYNLPLLSSAVAQNLRFLICWYKI